MGASFQSSFLRQITSKPVDRRGVVCVTICHNELGIIENFLNHYRNVGIKEFFIVDDRSTDGTYDFLLGQPDVSLFQPFDGSEFKDHVGIWRQEILDHFCVDRWATLPDADEFLYYKEMPTSLNEVATSLEAKGEEALIAVMVDMYADLPIVDQRFSGKGSLEAEFPFFDGQGDPPNGIRIVAQPSSFLKRFPTPQVAFMGGVRDRLFFQRKKLNAFQRWIISAFANINRPINPGFFERIQNRIVRAVTKSCFSSTPFVLNKFALIKWRRGMKFARAPHSVSEDLKVSERLAALLHFKFYKGAAALEYSAARGQHAGGSVHYRAMLSQRDALEAHPFNTSTEKFEGLQSLREILR